MQRNYKKSIFALPTWKYTVYFTGQINVSVSVVALILPTYWSRWATHRDLAPAAGHLRHLEAPEASTDMSEKTGIVTEEDVALTLVTEASLPGGEVDSALPRPRSVWIALDGAWRVKNVAGPPWTGSGMAEVMMTDWEECMFTYICVSAK